MTDKIEQDIQSAISKLDGSVVTTKEEIEKRFDEAIEALKEGKQRALKSCDELADQNRQELKILAQKVNNIRDILSKAEAEGIQSSHNHIICFFCFCFFFLKT